MISEKYNISDLEITCSTEEFERQVDANIGLVCDIIPYDDPDYHSKVIGLAVEFTIFSNKSNVI